MEYIDYKLFKKINKITNLNIAEYLGVSEAYVSMVTSGKTQFSEERFAMLLDHPTWDTAPLLGRAQEEKPTYHNPLNLPPTEKPSGDFPTAEPTDGQMVATNIPAWLPTSDDVEEVKAEEVPFVSKPVIESRVIDIREYVESGDAKKIIPQGLIEMGASYARKIYSDAMAPDIREGDIVLCAFVPDTSSMVDGDIYAVDTTKFGCVIRDIYHDGTGIILKARNNKFPQLRVEQSEIRSVAIPMQLVRSTFSARTDYAKIIRDREERIELLVNRERAHIHQVDKHLEHIDRLLEQVDRAATQQGQFLEQIDRVTAQQGKLIEALVEKKNK